MTEAVIVDGVRTPIARAGKGPAPATTKALARAGTIADIGLFEINEAFAAQVLACNTEMKISEMKISEDKLNINGGAVALGRPPGCSGARLMTTQIHEMRRRGTRLGVATMSIGMGQGVATVLEQI